MRVHICTAAPPSLPLWLIVHQELQTSARIRAGYDFLATQMAQSLGASR